MNNVSENMSRFASTSKTTGAFALTAGRYKRSVLEAAGYTFFSLGQGRTGGASRRYNGARLTPFGEGADNSTFDFRVFTYFVEKPTTDSSIEDEYVNVQYFGGGTATLSTAVGAGSSLLSGSERVADTATWTLGSSSTTPKGVGESVETARGQGRASAAWSPADNTEAYVDVPEFGGAAGLIIDFDLTGATAANMLVERLDS